MCHEHEPIRIPRGAVVTLNTARMNQVAPAFVHALSAFHIFADIIHETMYGNKAEYNHVSDGPCSQCTDCHLHDGDVYS